MTDQDDNEYYTFDVRDDTTLMDVHGYCERKELIELWLEHRDMLFGSVTVVAA